APAAPVRAVPVAEGLLVGVVPAGRVAGGGVADEDGRVVVGRADGRGGRARGGPTPRTPRRHARARRPELRESDGDGGAGLVDGTAPVRVEAFELAQDRDAFLDRRVRVEQLVGLALAVVGLHVERLLDPEVRGRAGKVVRHRVVGFELLEGFAQTG